MLINPKNILTFSFRCARMKMPNNLNIKTKGIFFSYGDNIPFFRISFLSVNSAKLQVPWVKKICFRYLVLFKLFGDNRSLRFSVR